jgi:hypothetical protein
MSEDKKVDEPKEEVVKEFSVDQTREELIEKLELDGEDNEELLDKLVADKQEEHKRFSTAIRQKIDWRTKYEGVEVEEEPEAPSAQELNEENILKKDDERLEERDLRANGLSEELSDKVKSYAKVNEVSVKEALGSDYIKFEIKAEEDNANAEEASLGGKSKANTKKGYSLDEVPQFDMKTKEGMEEFKKWEEWAKTQ